MKYIDISSEELQFYTLFHKTLTYVATLSSPTKTIFTATYVLLGNYSLTTNIWYWANASNSIDNIVANSTANFREEMVRKHKLKDEFILKNKVPIPKEQLLEKLNIIEKNTKLEIVVYPNDDVLTIIMLNNFLIDNRK